MSDTSFKTRAQRVLGAVCYVQEPVGRLVLFVQIRHWRTGLRRQTVHEDVDGLLRAPVSGEGLGEVLVDHVFELAAEHRAWNYELLLRYLRQSCRVRRPVAHHGNLLRVPFPDLPRLLGIPAGGSS